MTVPKKPLTKNESAIQLGNVLKYASRGGSTKAGILNKIKKLLIKPKSTKSSSKVTEVQTRPKKSLQNQKVNKSAKVPIEKLEQEHAVKTVVNKLNARTPIKIPRINYKRVADEWKKKKGKK